MTDYKNLTIIINDNHCHFCLVDINETNLEKNNLQYCSHKCYELDIKLKNIKKCFYCGDKINKEVKFTNHPEVFCSIDCRNNYWNEY